MGACRWVWETQCDELGVGAVWGGVTIGVAQSHYVSSTCDLPTQASAQTLLIARKAPEGGHEGGRDRENKIHVLTVGTHDFRGGGPLLAVSEMRNTAQPPTAHFGPQAERNQTKPSSAPVRCLLPR
jgi:hypothetical protein